MWSIEPLDASTYGLVRTKGRESKTVFQAFSSKDANEFLVMAEIYELVMGGAPVEAFAAMTTKHGRKAQRKY